MSEVYCWQCEKGYGRNKVLDIPVFRKGFTVVWCLNCVMKQLRFTNYRLIHRPDKYRRFSIKSIDDFSKEYNNKLNELELCFEKQFRKLKDIDNVWGELHLILQETSYNFTYGKETK